MSGFPTRNGRNFGGLVVGGPIDGKFLHHDAEQYHVNVLPELGSWFTEPNAEPDAFATATRFRYVWCRGFEGVTACDFWVPEGKDISWVLHEILGAYADRGRDHV